MILDASHRANGNTTRIAHLLSKSLDAEVFSLVDYDIGHYDYEFRNSDDDFLPLIRKIATYDIIVFATPVYWYSMSGRLKVFLDRISDCLKIEKAIGRSFAGKSMAVLSCGSEDSSILGFFEPFKLTADYLDMHYIGDVETWIAADDIVSAVEDRVNAFANKLLATSPSHQD